MTLIKLTNYPNVIILPHAIIINFILTYIIKLINYPSYLISQIIYEMVQSSLQWAHPYYQN